MMKKTNKVIEEATQPDQESDAASVQKKSPSSEQKLETTQAKENTSPIDEQAPENTSLDTPKKPKSKAPRKNSR